MLEEKKIVIVTVNDTLVNHINTISNLGLMDKFSILFDEAHRWTSDNKLQFILEYIHEFKINSLSLTAKLHSVGNGTDEHKLLLENNQEKHEFGLKEQ